MFPFLAVMSFSALALFTVTFNGKSPALAPPPCLTATKQGSVGPLPPGQAFGENISERVEISRSFCTMLSQLENPPFLKKGPKGGGDARPFTSTCSTKMFEDRRPLQLLLENKYTAQVYAESLGIPTIPLLAVLKRSQDIPWDTLPSRYVIKTNHWSGKVWIDVDGVDIRAGGSGEDHKQRKFDRAVTTREIDEIMPKSWTAGEWAASHIADKRILVQQYVPQALDIKVFTFHGRAAYYYVYALSSHAVKNVYDSEGRRTNYQLSSEPVPFNASDHRTFPEVFGEQKWANLRKYVDLLAKGLDFMRVDFVVADDAVRFIEYTNYPGGCGLPMRNDWDKAAGDLWWKVRPNTTRHVHNRSVNGLPPWGGEKR